MKSCRIAFILVVCVLQFCMDKTVLGQSDTVSFLHISDTHLIFDVDDFHPELVIRRKHYANGTKPLQKLLDSVSVTADLRFVAITGDLVDFYGAATADGSVRTHQIERFVDAITPYPLPVFLNLGNHDIVQYGWEDGKMTSSQRVAGKARAAWVRSAPVFREGTYYSRNVKAGATNYKLIFLENGYNSAGNLEPSKPPYIDRVQLEWLKEQLAESQDDVEVILMHIPFGKDAVGREFYEALAQQSSVRLILAGHEHENRVRELGPGGNLVQVQTGAFARNTANWRKIKLTPGAILISQPGRQDIERIIRSR